MQQACLPTAARCLREGYGATRVVLFGSLATGGHHVGSDLDLAASGGDLHQELLHAMGLAIKGIRPAVLSRESVSALRELLSFRHFFRNAYAVELDAERLSVLRRHLRTALPPLLTELDQLDVFLADLAEAADGQRR